MLIGLVFSFVIFCLCLVIVFFVLRNPKIKGSDELQQKILEDLATQLKEFQKIPQLLTSPAGLKQIGEKNLEYLLQNVLPKDFVLTQFEMVGVGIVDTAIKIGEHFLPIDSKFPKWNENRKELCSAVKDRIKEASKYVSPKHNTFPYSLMFIPAEAIYYKIFVEDTDMLDYARQHNVVPVSPSTLYAYLQILMDAAKRIEFSKNQENIFQTVKQSLNIFEGAKLSVDRSGKQMRDALTNTETAGKKIQDALDELNNLVKDKK